MAWEPKFDLLSSERFIDNIAAVFQRDAAAAIAYYQRDAELPSFAPNISAARTAAGPWPRLNLLPFGGDPRKSEDAARLSESHRILSEVETVSRVPDALTRYLVRYVTAVKSVYYEMSVEDVIGDIPKGQRAGLIWDVSDERYAERYYESEKLYTMVGSVVLTIRYTEGRSNGN